MLVIVPSGDHLGSDGDSTIDASPPATQMRFLMSLESSILIQRNKKKKKVGTFSMGMLEVDSIRSNNSNNLKPNKTENQE